MSLNGLEAFEINEAYQSALTDGGCWFAFLGSDPVKNWTDRYSLRLLLKYSTRDEVELYEKGSAGVAEAQEAVGHYGENSPLYGFIHFRRRKVVLKYIPQGTSRLLQGMSDLHALVF